MEDPQKVADAATEKLASLNCASVIVICPYFDDSSYYRIKTCDDDFETNDIENLINAVEVVLKQLRKEKDKVDGQLEN